MKYSNGLCTSAISRMASRGLGCRLGQLDVAIALPWLKEVICHSTWRRSLNPPPNPAPSLTCKHCLKIKALLAALQAACQEQHPTSSCSPAGHMPKAPCTSMKALSVAGCLLIQRCSTRQLWLPKVGSDISGLGVPPFLPQECASGCKRRQAKPNHHSSAISFCGYNYLLKKFPFFFCS